MMKTYYLVAALTFPSIVLAKDLPDLSGKYRHSEIRCEFGRRDDRDSPGGNTDFMSLMDEQMKRDPESAYLEIEGNTIKERGVFIQYIYDSDLNRGSLRPVHYVLHSDFQLLPHNRLLIINRKMFCHSSESDANCQQLCEETKFKAAALQDVKMRQESLIDYENQLKEILGELAADPTNQDLNRRKERYEKSVARARKQTEDSKAKVKDIESECATFTQNRRLPFSKSDIGDDRQINLDLYTSFAIDGDKLLMFYQDPGSSAGTYLCKLEDQIYHHRLVHEFVKIK